MEKTGNFEHISSRVKGSHGQIYGQNIKLSQVRIGDAMIDGTCSCPMEHNCKHVGAVLMQLWEKKCAADRTETELIPRMSPPNTPVILSDSINSWLEQLKRAQSGVSYQKEDGQRLLYVLLPAQSQQKQTVLNVQLCSVKRLKNGDFGTQVTHPLLNFRVASRAPKYFLNEDIELCSMLSHFNSTKSLYELGSYELIEKIIKTGRAYWKDHKSEPLNLGPALRGIIEWVLVDASGLRPRLIVEGQALPFGLSFSYVDTANGLVGKIETELLPLAAKNLLEAPPIAADQVELVSQALRGIMPESSSLKLPRPPKQTVQVDERPKLRLELQSVPQHKIFNSYYYGYGVPVVVCFAHPTLVYKDKAVSATEKKPLIEWVENGTLYSLKRNIEQDAF